jgi:hypothetical protein
MPELIRSIVARLRRFVGDRRNAKRHAVRIPCTIGLAAGRPGTHGPRRDDSLEGVTFDISQSGLRLLTPAIHVNGHYLTGSSGTLLVLLELPDGPILLHAVAVRYDRLEDTDEQMSYLIGLNVTDMNDQDRSRYFDYLKSR